MSSVNNNNINISNGVCKTNETQITDPSLQVDALSVQEVINKTKMINLNVTALRSESTDPKQVGLLFRAAEIKERVNKIAQRKKKRKSQQMNDQVDVLLGKVIEQVDKKFSNIQQQELNVKHSMEVLNNGASHQFSIMNIKIDDDFRTLINFPILCGKGVSKRVKLTADHAGNLYVRTSLPSKKILFEANSIRFIALNKIPNFLLPKQKELFKEIEKELAIQKVFDGHSEFVQVTHASVYHGSAGESKHMIVMEFCEKKLSQIFLGFSPRLLCHEKEKAMIDLLHGFLLGVAKMQKAGVIHRDLKPENVLVKISRSDGKKQYSAKISDFGFAIHDRDASTARPQGTPAFCSPETLRAIHSQRLVFQKREADDKILQLRHEVACLQARLCLPEVKNNLSSFLKTMEMIEAAKKSIQSHESLSNSYRWASTHGKSDVWACGLMIFELLYRRNFYEIVCPGTLSLEWLVNFAFEIKQENINEVCERRIFTTQFEKKLQTFIKKLLILNQEMRPDQEAAYLAFCSTFDLEPANYQFA